MNHPHQRPRRGLTPTMVAIVVAALGLITAGAFVFRSNDASVADAGADLAPVEQGSFSIVVPASGELAALKQTEIASRVEGRATLTFIVNEGEYVRKGDELVGFDDEAVKTRVREARLAVDNADARLAASKSALDIKRDASESQLSLADVDVELAELALKAWEEGDDRSERQRRELQVETTKKELDRLEARFTASTKLLADEFISKDEYDRDEIAMIRARSDFKQAELALKVYNDYTTRRERARLEADIKKATDRRDELAKTFENELANLERDVDNKQFALDSEKAELAKAEAQLENCHIMAPQDGLVVYASSLRTGRWGRNDDDPPTVGTEVRRNQTLIVLPDVSQMAAEVKVNEARSGKIKAGQSVVVYSDAVPDTPIQGIVDSVGVLAESGGWRDPNRRDYTVRIRLEEIEGLGLKPAMRAKALIEVDEVTDVTFVPVPAVFRSGATAFVYVPDGAGFAQRPIRTGRSSDLYIEVTDGLEPGETVLMRAPSTEEITSRIEDDAEGDRPTSDTRGGKGERRGGPNGGDRRPSDNG